VVDRLLDEYGTLVKRDDHDIAPTVGNAFFCDQD
jgi:hypothetical protein